MSKPSRMCWCDDMACRFVFPPAGVPKDWEGVCPTPRPLGIEKNGYDKKAVDPTDKWHGRLFTCSPLLSPNR